MTDQESLLCFAREAQLILARHIEHGDRDAEQETNKLLSGSVELVDAVNRLEGALGLLLPN